MSAALDVRPVDVLATARRLGQEFALTAARHDATGAVPLDNLRSLSAAGLLSLVIAPQDGGLGFGLSAAQAVIGEIARGEPATALILTMHYGVHAAIARRSGWPERPARRVIADCLGGMALANALQVEPKLGSPSRGGAPETLARRVPGGWSISGHKLYSTGCEILTWMLVLARTDESEPRVGSFLVPANAPGARIARTWNPLGMRATGSHDVIFENVVVPLDHALDLQPIAAPGRRDPLTMAWYFGMISALYDGVARAARDWLLGFLHERAPTGLGAPLATSPRIQEAVGEIEILLASNAHLLLAHAAGVERGDVPPQGGGFLKNVVVENAIQVTSRALELAGNVGLSRDNPLERHHRDALCGRVNAPQSDVIRGNLGRLALGVS